MGKRKLKAESVPRTSPDLVSEQIDRLKELFPEAVSEGKVDFDELRATLGEIVDDGPERYSFTWAGKRDAVRLLQVPSRATLKPSPDESISWDVTKNLFIEGENLEVLKLLYKSYAGRVKMIYIDPPYNTGNDFIYTDDFTDPLDQYLAITGQKDADGNLLTSNPETSGRYHSAWLSMMYPRLFVARQMLSEDGVIFVSIDDHEVANLRMVMNEIFGEENFIATVIWQKVYAPKNTARHFSEDHDYVVIYARNGALWQPELLPRTEAADARYENRDDDPRGPWKPSDMTARNYYSKGQYEVTSPSGRKFRAGVGRYWRQSYEKFLEMDANGEVWWGPNGDSMPAQKRFLKDVKAGIVPQTLWGYKDVGHTQEAKKELLAAVPFQNTENVLNTVKPVRLLQRMIQIGTEPTQGQLVLDFFAGSAPLGQAVMKQNRSDGGDRRFICVQMQEPLPKPEERLKTIGDIGKQRLRHSIEELTSASEGTLDLKASEVAEDLGYRIFTLAESNYRQWRGVEDADEDEYAEEMDLFSDPLLAGWKPEDVVWEVALKEGYSLSSSVDEVEAVEGNRVWRVSDRDRDQTLHLCLDDKLDDGTVRALGLGRDDLFVCRDVALTDEQAANLALTCKLKTI